MLSAATIQASTAISRASTALGTISAARRITSHAISRLMAIRATVSGQPVRVATVTAIHNPIAQAVGVISGTTRWISHGRCSRLSMMVMFRQPLIQSATQRWTGRHSSQATPPVMISAGTWMMCSN